MGFMKKLLGPQSKSDRSLPYTYQARVDVLSGRGKQPMYDYYFSDTICGLIDSLDELDFKPWEVELFGIYRDNEIPLEIEHCTSSEGKWLPRPEICHSLEEHYKKSLEEKYKGHVEKGSCSFEDRDRQGSGPYW